MADMVDFTTLDDREFYLRFAGDANRIDTYTLAEVLASLTDALSEINSTVNPDTEIKVYLERTDEGSLIARLSIRNIRWEAVWDRKTYYVETILLSLLASFIFEKLNYTKPIYRLEGEELVIETSKEVVKIPRSAFNFIEKVTKNPKVEVAIRRTFTAVSEDDEVQALDILPQKGSQPLVHVPRSEFDRLATSSELPLLPTTNELDGIEPALHSRSRIERTTLVILKAVLMKSRRKWEFIWRGFEISAPILHAEFFARLEAREISIRQGDALDVDLRINELYEPHAKVWRNISFQVIHVYNLIPGPIQLDLPPNALQ